MTGAVLLVCDVHLTDRRCVLYAGIYGRPDRLHPDQTRRRAVATAQRVRCLPGFGRVGRGVGFEISCHPSTVTVRVGLLWWQRRLLVATHVMLVQGAMVATVEAAVVNGAAAVASALGIEVG